MQLLLSHSSALFGPGDNGQEGQGCPGVMLWCDQKSPTPLHALSMRKHLMEFPEKYTFELLKK